MLLALLCCSALVTPSLAELRWNPVATTGAPGPRRGFAVGHDASTGSVLVFGGKPVNAETWRLDLGTRTWSQVATVGQPPQPRFSMFYGMEPGTRKCVGMHLAVGWGSRRRGAGSLGRGGVRWTLVGRCLSQSTSSGNTPLPTPKTSSPRTSPSPERYAEGVRHRTMQLIAGFREHMLPSSCCLWVLFG